jgi:SAM-dependent methyltransferase
MRRLHADGYDLADNFLSTFAQLGYWPGPGTRILDFGCGTGSLVYRFRDLGLDAYGFDIHDRVAYRRDEDRAWFGFCVNPAALDAADARIGRDDFRIPFATGMFDIIVSVSVLEHTLDLDSAMAEMARVLSSEGFAVHVHPGRSLLIEPHMYVPLATRFQGWWYFYLWALLGLRNEHAEAEKLTPRQTADLFAHYSKTGLIYRTERELIGIAERYFFQARFVDRLLHHYARREDRWKNFWHCLSMPHPLRALSAAQLTSALYAGFKRQ